MSAKGGCAFDAENGRWERVVRQAHDEGRGRRDDRMEHMTRPVLYAGSITNTNSPFFSSLLNL